MSKRRPFSAVFWVANVVEVFELFSYFGIRFGFGIDMTHFSHSIDVLEIKSAFFSRRCFAEPATVSIVGAICKICGFA